MKKKYECITCGGVIELDASEDEKRYKCCQKPNLKLLCVDKPEEDASIILGKNYEKIIEVLKYYIDLPEDYYKFIAIWIIGTYFHKYFSSYPFLFFNAMRGSGKTRTLKLVSSLGAGGDGSVHNSITESVLFRIEQGTTTCIDECERIGSKEKSTLRELLNAAYKKGIKVKRMKKVRQEKQETFVTEEFEPYIPIAMANIRGLDEVLEDRALTFILNKSNNPAVTKKVEDFDTNDTIKQIKGDLHRASVVSAVSLCSKKYIEKWNTYVHDKHHTHTNYTNYTHTHTTLTTLLIKQEELFNKIDDSGINGRNFELLFPLLIISYELSEDIFADILKIGLEIIKQKKKEESSESIDVSLIEFVAVKGESSQLEYFPIRSLLSEFRSYLGETDSEDTWLNTRWFGRALKRLNLTNDTRRLAGGREVMLNIPRAKTQLKIFKDVEENGSDN